MRCQVGGIRLQNHSIQWTVLRDALCSLAAPDHTNYTEDAVGEDLQRFFQEFCSSLKGMDVNLVLPRQGRFQDVHCVVVSITSMDDYRKIEILGVESTRARARMAAQAEDKAVPMRIWRAKTFNICCRSAGIKELQCTRECGLLDFKPPWMADPVRLETQALRCEGLQTPDASCS